MHIHYNIYSIVPYYVSMAFMVVIPSLFIFFYESFILSNSKTPSNTLDSGKEEEEGERDRG